MPFDETPTGPDLPPPAPDSPQPAEPPPNRVRAGRFGELETHELLHLLDSFDTERERARFRESMYLSTFLCVLMAWLVFYGPRFLWHQPKLKNPADVLHERELTQLSVPTIAHAPVPAARPAPAPHPALDNKTLENLRAMTKPATPLPETPQPATPQPSAPQPPQPSTPQPRTPAPVLADAPTPQPTRPTFGRPSQSAGDAIQSAANATVRDRGGRSDAPQSRSGPLNLGGVEILSDTQGVNFDPYLRRLMSDIRRNWLPLIPQEALPPLSKQGETLIRFSILPDGSISEMHLDGSTHDEAINRSAWGSITSEGQFPPLPSQFHGPVFTLRIHYLVNKGFVE